ncbi:aquaporin-like protein [Mycena alexandri]|uniref:Aquaporin-like protein n=1 Tax=Mycena alexandri TaxID=1745969 RepID=A0AAD6X0P0_9AGAR|nr:aquaporin-like protein [Mycena alexandri]
MTSEIPPLDDNFRNIEPANLTALRIEDPFVTMPESPGILTEKALEANSVRSPRDSKAVNNLSLRIDPPFTMTDFPGSFVRIVQEGQPSFVPRRSHTLVAYFTHGWTSAEIWKAALIEFWAVACMTYIGGLIGITVMSFGTNIVAPYVGIITVFLLALWISAAAPGSGGHINSTITFAVLLTRLMSFSRGVLYLAAQLAGSALAGGLLRASFGLERAIEVSGGGCKLARVAGSVSPTQAFVIEACCSTALLFVAFGIGLDPRQQMLYGPALGPVSVGLIVGLIVFATAGLAPGYPGASMNPNRCFAFAVARGDFQDQWIWWTGPALAGLIHSFLYTLVPPYHRRPTMENRKD